MATGADTRINVSPYRCRNHAFSPSTPAGAQTCTGVSPYDRRRCDMQKRNSISPPNFTRRSESPSATKLMKPLQRLHTPSNCAQVAAACEVTLPELEEQLKEAEQSEARRADERCAAALVSLDGLLDAWNSAHLELGGMCATQLKEHQRALKERADGELQSSAELDDQNTQDSASSAAPRSRAPSPSRARASPRSASAPRRSSARSDACPRCSPTRPRRRPAPRRL